MKIISSYFFVEANDIEQIHQLTHASIRERISLSLHKENFFTFLLDGVLGVEIHKSFLSRKFLQHPSLEAIDTRVEDVLNNTLNQRAEIYSKPRSYPYRTFLEERFLLSPLEREFFLSQKLKAWLYKQLHSRLITTEHKKKWLNTVNNPNNILHKTFEVSFDYKNSVLYNLQTLYKTYSLEEEIFSVAHALGRIHLSSGVLFLQLYQSEVLLNPSYLESARDKETAFRVEFLTIAYTCLRDKNLPENTNELDNLFDDFYQNAVIWTLVATIRNNPDLTDLFAQIPEDSSFWEETQLSKKGWDFVVKTLDLSTNIYASFPNQQFSEKQQHLYLNPTLLTG